MRKAAVLALSMLLFTACAARQPGSQGLNADRISRVEIEEAGPSSAYDLVRRLRPIWLRKRGNTSFTQDSDVLVYLDGTRLGETDSLRGIRTDNLERLEYWEARRANNRFGPGHQNGAILLFTRG